MNSAFSPAGRALIRKFLARPTLLGFDFDGTLAPVVNEPDAARIPKALAKEMIELGLRAPVALITGRSLADVGPKLGFVPLDTVGNHGLEGELVSKRVTAKSGQVARQWVRQLKTMGLPKGVWVEDKNLSLSVHYRGVADPIRISQLLCETLGMLEPAPYLLGGKFVWNALPNFKMDKGTAFAAIMKRRKLTRGLFVGDDVTDEKAFELPKAKVLGIRVGKTDATHAQLYVEKQTDVRRLVKLISELIR